MKTDGRKHGNKRYKKYIPLQKPSTKSSVKTKEEDLGWNTTRLSVCSQKQHPFYKIPSLVKTKSI